MQHSLQEIYDSYAPNSTLEYIVQAFKDKGVDCKSIILEAHGLTLNEAKAKLNYYQNRNWIANTMNGNIIGKMRDAYPELMRIDGHGRPYMELQNDIHIYFKKMDANFRVNNIPTKHVEDLWSQLKGSGEAKIHVLFVGFILEKEDWSAIRGVYAAYPSDYFKRKVDWKIDLQHFVKEHTLIKVEEQVEDLEVKPKRKDENKKIG
ncbi:MAG: hypothetical protein U0V74_04705 [Chitinophagales bacterium]